jgi:dTDP-4-dehydrorhamnose reductase
MMPLSSFKVLIIGGGFVSQTLSESLTRGGCEVDVLVQSEIDYLNPKKLGVLFGSRSSMGRSKYSLVINACGVTGKKSSLDCDKDKETTWKINAEFPVRLAKLCYDFSVPLVHISTGCLFNNGFFDEADSPNFGLFNDNIPFYQQSKHAAERGLMGLIDELKGGYFKSAAQVYIFRIRLPFGAVVSPKNFACKLMKFDSLIDAYNSYTDLSLLNLVVYSTLWRIHDGAPLDSGIYNVVNDGVLSPFLIEEAFFNAGRPREFGRLNKQDFATSPNCTLSNRKLKLALNLDGKIPTAQQALTEVLKQIN